MRKVNRLGRYLITGRLGQGGMGVVYEAEDTLLHRQVAIKLLPRETAANAEALKRFQREAQAAAKLNHPNVVAVHDVGEADGTHYIVMELVRGGSAQDFLAARGPFHWVEATGILRDVCRGVAAAHKAGLIHRDIKPANVLRSAEGVVKLADFGLVKTAGRKATVVTALGGVVGTPHFMSPEQSQGGSVDERSDIYSLGATYFALLTGRPPYPATDPMEVIFAHNSKPIPDPREAAPNTPEGSVAILRRAMAKQRSQRYASATEMLADLERLLAQHSGPVSPAWVASPPVEAAGPASLVSQVRGEHTEAPPAPRRRRRWALALLGVLLLALLIRTLFQGRPEPAPTSGAEDWPALAARAERAVRQRNAADMRDARERMNEMQQRSENEALRPVLARLEKALAFRESITPKGLVLGMGGSVTAVTFSPDDRWLAASQIFGDGGAFVWDSHTGEKRPALWPRRGNSTVRVQALAFSHDSAVLAAALADEPSIKLRTLADGKESTLAAGPGVSRVLCVRFSPVVRHLVAGFEPATPGPGRPYLRAWDIATGQSPFPFKTEHSARIASVDFCAGGEQVASGSHDRRVVLWNAETGRIWREMRTGTIIQAIACDPQGRTLAVAGQAPEGAVLQFWDYAGERLLATKPSQHGSCRSVAFTRKGSILASSSGSRIVLWNADTQELLATLEGHGQDVTSLAFSGEGGILASGSDDQTMRLWDVSRLLP